MKKKLIAGMTSTALIASIGAPAFAANFSDVSGHWAASTINKLADAGIINGLDASNFAPDATLTRAQFAKMISVALKLDTTSTTSSFSDVSGWAVGYVEAAKKAGIINGTDATHFDPNGTLTREQAAAIMVRALKTQVTLEDGSDINFPDAASVSSWFKTDVATAIKYGLLNGKDGQLAPQGNATRAEAAVLTDRFLTKADELNNAAIKVSSVSAINAKQIQVKFNKAADKTIAETEANYFVRKSADATSTDLATLGTVTATLQEDGKTVLVTANGSSTIEGALGVASGAVFEFTVKNIKDANGKVADSFTQTLKVNDTTAPAFVSAVASAKTSTNVVTLTFSEPVVVSSGVVKVNGAFGSVAQGSTPNTLTVTTGSNLDAGKSYDVQLLNFTDYAGNFLTPNPINTTVVVSANTAAPSVTDVKVVRDNLIEVTFDKAMAPGTLSNATIKLLDGNFSNLAATNITNVVATDSTNKVFNISLDDTPALPFVNGVFNATLVFSDSITDSVGNKLNIVNRPVSISRDVVAPAVVSAKHVKASTTAGANYGGVALTNGAIVVQFNEKVSKGTLTGLKLIDNNGVDVTSTYVTATEITAAAVSSTDATEVVIPLKAVVPTTLTSFTLRLPAGVANDLALDANASTAAVNSFVTVPGSGTTSDTTAPVATAATPAASNEIQIAVTEANALDASTVLDLNNYRVDGAPLPAGTYATITGTAPSFVIHLFLPAGSISTTRNYAVNVAGIKDTAGNAMTTTAFNTVALVDDVKPVLQTAVLNADGTVSLAYSEALAAPIAASDLVVKLNGYTVATSSLGVAHVSAGAEAGKDVVTVKVSVDKGTDTAFGGGDDTLFIDTDATAGLSAGDIVLATAGTYTAANDGAAYDLTKASTLTVATITNPVSKDTSANNNTLKGGTTITVK